MAVDERIQETNIYNDNYRTQYPPAQVGQDAFRRATARNLEESRIRSQQAQSSYADMYNRSRQGSYLNQMAGAPTGFTGGMRTQYDTARSSAEMQAVNQIGVNQERALRDIELNRLAMDQQAVQEGYQAEDRARQTTAYNMQLEQQRQAILADENMTDDQKMQMMMSSGMDYATAAAQVQPASQGTFGERLTAGEVSPIAPLATVGGIAAGGIAAKGLAQGIAANFSPALAQKLGATLSTSIASNAVAGGVTKFTASSLLLPPSGAQLAPILGKVTTSVATTGKFAKLGSWLVTGAKAVGLTNPYVLGALGAAALITGGIALYNRSKQNEETTAPNYYSMATG